MRSIWRSLCWVGFSAGAKPLSSSILVHESPFRCAGVDFRSISFLSPARSEFGRLQLSVRPIFQLLLVSVLRRARHQASVRSTSSTFLVSFAAPVFVGFFCDGAGSVSPDFCHCWMPVQLECTAWRWFLGKIYSFFSGFSCWWQELVPRTVFFWCYSIPI
jgi:hypothetical protein